MTDDRYPHRCPECGHKAYLGGEANVECTNEACKHLDRKLGETVPTGRTLTDIVGKACAAAFVGRPCRPKVNPFDNGTTKELKVRDCRGRIIPYEGGCHDLTKDYEEDYGYDANGLAIVLPKRSKTIPTVEEVAAECAPELVVHHLKKINSLGGDDIFHMEWSGGTFDPDHLWMRNYAYVLLTRWEWLFRSPGIKALEERAKTLKAEGVWDQYHGRVAWRSMV